MYKLPEDQIERITSLLKEGKPIPEDYKTVLFETKKEYELVYADKAREDDVLADTMAVPLQLVKTFQTGNTGVDWNNMLIFGNNLQALKTLLQMKREGKLKSADGTPGIKLVYIDPPFASKQDFRGSQDQKAYQDKIAGADFLEYLRKRLLFLRELLAEDGAIYVHLDWRKAHYVKALMDEIFGEESFRNELIWTYNGKGLANSKGQFVKYYAQIYFYARSPATSIDNRRPGISSSVLERFGRYLNSSNQITFKTLTDNHEEAELKKARKRFLKEFGEEPSDDDIAADYGNGYLLKDIWDDIPIIRENKKYVEYTGYPTQKPEALLARIVAASSKQGDLVLDCFAGSGTTMAASEKLGRRWIGIDCGKLSVYTIQKRLLTIAGSKSLENPKKKYGKECTPFALYNAGLYDYQALKELPWEQYRQFALALFQCRDEPHAIGGLALDGHLGEASVMVFNYQKHESAMVDRTFVEQLHAALGKKIRSRFFLIVPAGSVAFLEDYIEFDGVKYYILRIPYSIIEEIHKHGFSKLKQPVSESDVNDTVDAVGFDFVQTPTVDCTYTLEKVKDPDLLNQGSKECVIGIKTFESRVLSKKPVNLANLESLSMVMLDYNFDGEVFDLDDVFYAEDLKKNNYEVRFASDKIDGQCMIIYLDIFGNEKREIKKLSDFTKSKGR